MPTGHGDGLAICRLERSSPRRQPCSFLGCSGLRARIRVSLPRHAAQTRANPLVRLPSIPRLNSRFSLLFSLFLPSPILWSSPERLPGSRRDQHGHDGSTVSTCPPHSIRSNNSPCTLNHCIYLCRIDYTASIPWIRRNSNSSTVNGKRSQFARRKAPPAPVKTE